MAIAYSSTNGIAYPEDLILLKSVHDDVCFQRGFDSGSRAADDVGKVLMSLFADGIHDEVQIRASVERHLGCPSPAAQMLRGGQ